MTDKPNKNETIDEYGNVWKKGRGIPTPDSQVAPDGDPNKRVYAGNRIFDYIHDQGGKK